MLLLCSYYIRTIRLCKRGVLRAQPHTRRREGAARPHAALSPKGFPPYRETHKQRIQRVKERIEEERREEREKQTEKHLLKALILFCDKFCANLKNTPGKQQNGSKMTEKHP